MRFSFFVAWSMCCRVLGAAWSGQDENILPIVDVNLAPPSKPHPELLAEIGSLSKGRESFAHANMDAMQDALVDNLSRARNKIGATVGRLMRIFDDRSLMQSLRNSGSRTQRASEGAISSFLALPPRADALPEKLSVKINVLTDAPLDQKVKGYVDEIDQRRTSAERLFFEQVVGQFGSLTDLVVTEMISEFQTQLESLFPRLGAHMYIATGGFAELRKDGLNSIPQQGHVRVVASDAPYPTVANMVQAMEERRDISEDLEKTKVLKMQVDLLKAENAMVKEAIAQGVARVVDQYKEFLKHEQQ